MRDVTRKDSVALTFEVVKTLFLFGPFWVSHALVDMRIELVKTVVSERRRKLTES